ncbi:hypothetical protein JCM9140_4265 [Halalkalibacter wakoensis JCM 9140]|uniref:Extracellular solute-binding protein n=1 Tax=Halalkalibacter wakoensis JCM 9140 TaxID=1236970 RepID=W4Q7Y3_9BACI|nr:extracellular solute-binding protein [Halalkalibacter wakoensis]GAE28075.1 hypothetical protein JCM9140_4265 [Halalkalibacter wakoensis JCM 9140]
MKRLIVLFTVMIFALLLVACGNNEETSQQSTSDSESNTDSNSNEESVHLTMSIAAGQNPERFRWEAEAFTEKYPHVTVEVVEYEEDWYNQNAVRLFNSSDRPDVAFFWLTGFYDSIVNSGALLPLDDLYESEGWYDVLPESTVEGAISQMGINMELHTLLL